MTLPSLLVTVLLAQASAPPADAPLVAPRRELKVRERAKQTAWVGGGIAVLGATLFVVGSVQYARAPLGAGTPEDLAKAQENALHNSVGGAALLLVGACVLWIAANLWESQSPPQVLGLSLLPTRDAHPLVLGTTP